MKLYEISHQYEEIMSELESTEGVLTPEIEQRLDAVEDILQQKMENIACLIRQFQADGELCKSECNRLTALRKSRERAADGLKAYALANLQRMNLKKVEAGRFVISRQSNPERVVIDNEDEVLSKFWIGKLTLPVNEIPEELIDIAVREVNKTAIKEYHKNYPQEEITGIHFELGESLRIR